MLGGYPVWRVITGGSLNSHYSQLFFFWGIFWGKEMLPKFPFTFFIFLGNLQISSLLFSLFFWLPNSLILFYFIYGFTFCLFFFPLFLASKFCYWFFFLFGLSNFLIFISWFQISLVFFFFLLPNFLFLFKKKIASFAPIMKFGLHLDLVLALLGFLLHYFQQILFI